MTTTVVNLKTDEYDVYIGRWNKWLGLPRSKWYNPFKEHKYNKDGTIKVVRDGTREDIIAMFNEYILEPRQKHLLDSLPEIKDKVLGCYCKPLACHGDILAMLADRM
jgi:Domain of unknown function (DUF4326)